MHLLKFLLEVLLNAELDVSIYRFTAIIEVLSPKKCFFVIGKIVNLARHRELNQNTPNVFIVSTGVFLQVTVLFGLFGLDKSKISSKCITWDI